MGSPLVCPLLIGRDEDLARLSAALDAATDRGGVMLVTGEAGVGKSRLLDELLAQPEAAAWARLRVGCLEPDRTEPYALVLALAHAAGVTSDLPLGGAPEAERQVRRVEQALRAVLERFAAGRPLILTAEDLHWSDGPSLSALLALAQRPGRTLMLMTYRPAQPTPALAGFLTELHRLRLTHEIPLHPLERAAVARMIRVTLGLDAPVSGALLDEVMGATDGIPFLVEEVLRSLIEGGALEQTGTAWRRRPSVPLRVPGSLQQAIQARLLSQPADVAGIAALAAVLGQVIDVDLLRSLAECCEPELLTALRALTEAQLLVVRPDGSLAFRHALARDAVLDRLLEPERRGLHRRVARALDAGSESTPTVLAYHWAQARDLERAAPYALRAAERAAALHAHREAIGQYEIALAGGAASVPDLSMALGDSHAALGELEAAVAWYERASAHAGERGEVTRTAEIELRIGLAYAADRWRNEASEHLARAFAGLPSQHPSRWRAGLHLALQRAAQGEYIRADETLTEALVGAAEADLLAPLRLAYELGGLRSLRGDWAALEEAGSRVLRESPEDSDEGLALCSDAHAALGSVAYYRGTMDTALEHFTACLGIARRRGLTVDEAMARWNRATNALYHLGRWSDARVDLAETQTLGTMLATTAGWFELWLDGRWEEAVEAWLAAWSEQLASSGDLEVQTAHGRRIADLLLVLGRTGDALILLAPVLSRIREVGARSFELQLAPREAEALVRLSDPRAEAACETGLALARELGGQPAEALLLRARALAHRAAGRWPEAFADFDQAVAILLALPMPYEAARTLREAGLVRLGRGRRGDRERGAEHLRAAGQIFAEIGAARDRAATSGILSAAGLAERAGRGPGPLSPREREVAELIALGSSNREIAGRLFITEKTAAYHVGAILTKLGYTSRAQIATYMAGGATDRPEAL